MVNTLSSKSTASVSHITTLKKEPKTSLSMKARRKPKRIMNVKEHSINRKKPKASQRNSTLVEITIKRKVKPRPYLISLTSIHTINLISKPPLKLLNKHRSSRRLKLIQIITLTTREGSMIPLASTATSSSSKRK